MGLPIKYGLVFSLKDLSTRKELGTFKARVIRDRSANFGSISGNIQSGGNSYSVATPKNIGFNGAGTQQVTDLGTGVSYIITSVRGLTHTQVGRTYSRARQLKEIILELE